jgi:hypothetical protein
MPKDEWPMANRPKPEEVKAVRVIPWEAQFGVAVDYNDGARHCAYPVGTRDEAAAEVRRLLGQHEGAALS